jgi:hypothetical protein
LEPFEERIDLGKRREYNPFAAISGVSGRNAPIADLLQMGMHKYQKGFTHPTKEAAQEHAAMLRRQEFGVMKRKVYRGIRIVREKSGGFTVQYAQSKGYLRWLRTGRS